MANFNKKSINTYQVMRLKLAGMVKDGAIQDNRIIGFTITYSNGNSIGIESNLTNETPYIKLNYSMIDRLTGREKKHKYHIELNKQLSNFGKGHYYYYLCPFSGNKARILYFDKDSGFFKCLKAFDKNIL